MFLFVYSDHYVVNVAWASETAVTVSWLNRNQDESILHVCDPASSFCKQVSFSFCLGILLSTP